MRIFSPVTRLRHLADFTLSALNAKVSDATLDDQGDPRDPNPHAATHQDGGSDEISVAGLSGELADPQTAKAHASDHEPGGSDAMTVDAAASTGSLRTLGSGSTQAAAGDHAHGESSRAYWRHFLTGG